MPIFDYRCRACGRGFEDLVTRPDEKVTCPDCGGPADRLLSAFAAPASAAGSGGCAPDTGCAPGGG